MTVKDFRIGNLTNLGVVIGIDQHTLRIQGKKGIHTNKKEFFSPMKITEKSLENMGFWNHSAWMTYHKDDNREFTIENRYKDKDKKEWYVRVNNEKRVITYIHEMQNYCYLLNGFEI